MNPTPKRWSDGLRQATRETLEDLPMLPGGLVHMKHIDRGFGTMALVDLLAGRYEIVDKEGGGILCFDDVDAVIDAGWAID